MVCIALLLLSVGSAACDKESTDTGSSADSVSATAVSSSPRLTPAQRRRAQAMTSPVRARAPRDETNALSGSARAARLGRYLFYDTRLSANGEVSCASCHQPDHGFSAPTSLGVGVGGATPRHPPTLLNVAYQRWFDWDGKADSLWRQAARPIEHPGEHGITRVDVARLILADAALRQAYEEATTTELPPASVADAWPEAARPVPEAPNDPAHKAWESMTPEARAQVDAIFVGVLKSLAAYEEQLVTFDTPFDRWARGEEGAMAPDAKRGMALFMGEAKCVACHNGPTFSDMSFHNLGLPETSWMPRGDEGRWDGVPMVKGGALSARGAASDDRSGERAQWLEFLKRTREDHGQFKTPPLRGVAWTPPYMHGGQFETLEEVVDFYNRLPGTAAVGHREELLKPLGLTEREQRDLVAFLKALTPKPLPEELTRQPTAP